MSSNIPHSYRLKPVVLRGNISGIVRDIRYRVPSSQGALIRRLQRLLRSVILKELVARPKVFVASDFKRRVFKIRRVTKGFGNPGYVDNPLSECNRAHPTSIDLTALVHPVLIEVFPVDVADSICERVGMNLNSGNSHYPDDDK